MSSFGQDVKLDDDEKKLLVDVVDIHNVEANASKREWGSLRVLTRIKHAMTVTFA